MRWNNPFTMPVAPSPELGSSRFCPVSVWSGLGRVVEVLRLQHRPHGDAGRELGRAHGRLRRLGFVRGRGLRRVEGREAAQVREAGLVQVVVPAGRGHILQTLPFSVMLRPLKVSVLPTA